ncbi:hypothetical protein CKA32_005364 [Geitlerinema sp. FC II]|nr:hypothetical protein CKA32_005364 [Geitlerinema sp. FC II]
MEFKLDTVTEIFYLFSSLSWEWNRTFWNCVCTQKSFREIERVSFQNEDIQGGRITYIIEDLLSEVSVYFSDPSLKSITWISVLLNYFEGTDELSEDEYDCKINEFQKMFQDVVNIAIFCLNHPRLLKEIGDDDFPEDYDALRIAIWEIENAQMIVKLEHQDMEVPIILDLVIEPLHLSLS